MADFGKDVAVPSSDPTSQAAGETSKPPAPEPVDITIKVAAEKQLLVQMVHGVGVAPSTGRGATAPIDPLNSPSLEAIEAISRLTGFSASTEPLSSEFWGSMENGIWALKEKHLERERQFAEWARQLQEKEMSLNATIALARERHLEKESSMAFREEKLKQSLDALEKDELERVKKW